MIETVYRVSIEYEVTATDLHNDEELSNKIEEGFFKIVIDGCFARNDCFCGNAAANAMLEIDCSSNEQAIDVEKKLIALIKDNNGVIIE